MGLYAEDVYTSIKLYLFDSFEVSFLYHLVLLLAQCHFRVGFKCATNYYNAKGNRSNMCARMESLLSVIRQHLCVHTRHHQLTHIYRLIRLLSLEPLSPDYSAWELDSVIISSRR